MRFTVTLRHSAVWQMSSAVLSSQGACLLVDPGYFPRELDELAGLCSAAGGALGEPVGVVFTHGHWDHVVGWQRFPTTPVWGSPSLSAAVRAQDGVTERCLAEAREFDDRWYVARPWPLRWPQVKALSAGARLEVGGLLLEALLLPGHSADGLALLAPEQGLLLCGDYLSPCEIPFVEDLPGYRSTLQRLLTMLRRDLQQVIPGHGPALSRDEALAIAIADLAYLDQLALLAERGDRAGALALPLPRAAETPGMREHHLENCSKAGLS